MAISNLLLTPEEYKVVAANWESRYNKPLRSGLRDLLSSLPNPSQIELSRFNMLSRHQSLRALREIRSVQLSMEQNNVNSEEAIAKFDNLRKLWAQARVERTVYESEPTDLFYWDSIRFGALHFSYIIDHLQELDPTSVQSFKETEKVLRKKGTDYALERFLRLQEESKTSYLQEIFNAGIQRLLPSVFVGHSSPPKSSTTEAQLVQYAETIMDDIENKFPVPETLASQHTHTSGPETHD